MKKTVLIVATALVVVVVAAAASWGLTRGEDEASARGVCGSQAWELEVEDDDGTLEVSFELQSSAPGETWQVSVEQGRTVLLSGERTTDADGELDLDAPARSGGEDDFTVTATPTEGEVCTATVTR